MISKPEMSLEDRYKKARAEVERAQQYRDDAIRELIDYDKDLAGALLLWGKLRDQIEANDPSRITEAAWNRRLDEAREDESIRLETEEEIRLEELKEQTK